MKHNYFFIAAMKSYWSILSCWMFLISLKSGKFSKKDKNAKVRYGEYQYVSTPTLTMSEFDPAFLAFIRCRILSLVLYAVGSKMSLKCLVFGVQCGVHNVQCKVYNVECSVCSVQCKYIMYSVKFIMYSIQFEVWSTYCVV